MSTAMTCTRKHVYDVTGIVGGREKTLYTGITADRAVAALLSIDLDSDDEATVAVRHLEFLRSQQTDCPAEAQRIENAALAEAQQDDASASDAAGRPAVEAQPSGQATTSGELPRDVLHEITSTPIAGVVYVVRIDTSLKVYVHHGDLWNYCGRLDCAPGRDSLQLIADHFAGQLATNRRIERGWRGEITPERVAADRDVALTLIGGE